MPIEQYKFRLYLLDSSFCEIVLDRFFATKNCEMSSQTYLAKFATRYLGQPFFLQIVKLDQFLWDFFALRLTSFYLLDQSQFHFLSSTGMYSLLAALAAGDFFFPEKYFARPTGTVLLCLSVIALAGKFFMRDQML